MWSSETIRLVASLPQSGVFMGGQSNALDIAPEFFRSIDFNWFRVPVSFPIDTAAQAAATELSRQCAESDLTCYIVFDFAGITIEQLSDQHFPVDFARQVAVIAEQCPEANIFGFVAPSPPDYLAEDALSSADYAVVVAQTAKATLLAKQAIKQAWHRRDQATELIFTIEQPLNRALALPGSNQERLVKVYNAQRFLYPDLIFGNDNLISQAYLLDNGVAAAEYTWLIDHGGAQRTLLAFVFDAAMIQKFQRPTDEPHDTSLIRELLTESADRYGAPFFLQHTLPTELSDSEAIATTDHNIIDRLRTEGYPAVGISYILTAVDEEMLQLQCTVAQSAASNALASLDHRNKQLRMRPHEKRDKTWIKLT